jgi:hypothetical protein
MTSSDTKYYKYRVELSIDNRLQKDLESADRKAYIYIYIYTHD